MVLGIIGAMAVEIATLKENMEDLTVTTRAGMDFCEGKLQGVPAVVVQSGVGKVNAAMCTQILCDCFGVTHVVNTGVAGSLSAQLDIGDLVVSRDVMHHDMDCNYVGYPIGQVPGMDVLAFPADDALNGKITAMLAGDHDSVELNNVVDPSIIGGFILEADSKRLDASVGSQLREIRKQLVKQNRKLV